MIEETMRLLHEARLTSMAARLKQWMGNPKNMTRSHTDCVHALVSAHLQSTHKRQTDRFLAATGFAPTMALANVWTGPRRGLTDSTLANLANGVWLREGTSLVITGPHGSGKTFLAAALAREACVQGQRATYCTLAGLLDDGADGAPGVAIARIHRLRSPGLLVIDHFAEEIVPEHLGAHLRDLIDERIRRGRSTIFVSSRAMDDWPLVFENPDTAEAICSKVHNATAVITLKRDRRSGAASINRNTGQRQPDSRPTGGGTLT